MITRAVFNIFPNSKRLVYKKVLVLTRFV